MLTLAKINSINNGILKFLCEADKKDFVLVYSYGIGYISHHANIEALMRMLCEDNGIDLYTLTKEQQDVICSAEDLFKQLANSFGLEQAQEMLRGKSYRYTGEW